MDSIPPEPDRDAGSIRSREILKILQSEGYSITFEPLGTGRHVKYALNLMADGINYVPHGTIKELSDSISHQEENFAALCGWEVIIVSRRVVFQENLSYIKRLCPKTPIIFDTIDLNFLREQRDFEEMVQRLKGSTLLDPFSKAAGEGVLYYCCNITFAFPVPFSEFPFFSSLFPPSPSQTTFSGH